jgi:uncharacterized protein YcbK (DUF882 family)
MSVLLASCTATTGEAPVGFASPAYSDLGPTGQLMAEVAASEAAVAASSEIPEKEAVPDSSVSDQVAAEGEEKAAAPAAVLPTPRPDTAATGETIVAADTESPTPASSATVPVDAEAVADRQDKSGGFLASLFGPSARAEPVSSGRRDASQPQPSATIEQVAPQSAEPAQPSEATAPEAGSETASPPATETVKTEEPTTGSAVEESTETATPEEPAADAPPALALAAPVEPKKRGFLETLFGGSANAAQATDSETARARAPQTTARRSYEQAGRRIVTLSATASSTQSELSRAATGLGDDLPGVRKTALFEITRRSGLDDDSDIDLYEGEGQDVIQVASAAGLARLAPNGLLKQREDVDVSCLKPSLVHLLKTVEGHFGRKLIITSGYRSPPHNRRVRGARNSMHMYCAAADVQLPGVSKWELARFVRALPGRGGVGTYCHTDSVHIDVGPERDWNWRCRRGRK